MKKIIISIIVIGFILSATPMVTGEEAVEEQEELLFKELEKLLAFEGITAEKICETLPFADDSGDLFLDTEENLRSELSLEIEEIEESYEMMMEGDTPANPIGNGETEYWAVLIGADFNELLEFICIPFDENIELMNNMLLSSDHWQEDHIISLINEDVTLVNIIVALLWLDHMDDGDDISFVYYTAHGSQLNNDILPYDEADGKDEFLTTHWTGLNPFSIVTDDLLNFLLNRLDSECIAVLIDACHSGGMIDSGHENDRVMATSCDEDELGMYIYFGKYFMKGLLGYGDEIINDGNGDDVVSAEEAFNYVCEAWTSSNRPNIILYDGYDGDLQLTDVEFPPDPPVIDGPLVGKVNTVHNYQVSATDPDGDNIRYGLDWDADINKDPGDYMDFEPVKYEVEEWSDFHSSGETCTMSHSWGNPGIYDIRVRSQDNSGITELSPKDYWSKDTTIIIPSNSEILDQFQTKDEWDVPVRYSQWCAQSFKPDFDKISKVYLELDCSFHEDYNIDFSIRSNLYGDNLVEISKNLEAGCNWVEFVFPAISVTPDETYYIVLEKQEGSGPWWRCVKEIPNEYNPYPDGHSYISYDRGGVWYAWSGNIGGHVDFCFVVSHEQDYCSSYQSSQSSISSSSSSSISSNQLQSSRSSSSQPANR